MVQRRHNRLVLGLGSDILGDDAFGLVVAQMLKSSPVAKLADIEECMESGYMLLDHLEGYDEVFIVDAFLDPNGKRGKILEFDIEEDSTPPASWHFSSLGQALHGARLMGMQMPKRIKAFAAVINEIVITDRGLDETLMKSARKVVQRIEEELGCTSSR